MVKSLLKLLDRELSGLHQAALFLSISALTSQLLGLVRDRLLASAFGVGRTLDIYYASFRIPDLVYVSVASLVSVTVLIPFVLTRLADGKEAEAKRFLSGVVTLFSLMMVLVSVGLYIIIPWLIIRVVPGFTVVDQLTVVELSRIILISPFLLGLSNLFASITQAYRRFVIYSLSPIFYNLGIIFGILWLYPYRGLSGLAWGVVLGALLHLVIQLPTITKLGFLPTWRLVNWQEIKPVLVVSLPRTFTLGCHQLVQVGLVMITSLLPIGSIAVFTFALNLQSVPLALIGVSYSVAAFPTLTALYTKGSRAEFLSHIGRAARHIVFWSVPVMVLFMVLRAHIVRVILGAGAFDWTATRLTAAAVAIFVLSLAAQNLVLLLVRGYYAGGKTKTPLVAAGVMLVITSTLAWVLVTAFNTSSSLRLMVESLLRIPEVPGTAVIMIPLAFTIGVTIQGLLLWQWFRRDFGWVTTGLRRATAESLGASLIGGVAAYSVLLLIGESIPLSTTLGVLTQGLLAGIVGIIVIAILLLSISNQEIVELKRSLTRRRSQETIVPEVGEL
ncbi:MAG: hypothetical protein HYV76_00475 [Candidatus Vogelbacteria bacterium]|nr:hypothetical protein [Candidatus Vogelbacteria bacterium]